MNKFSPRLHRMSKKIVSKRAHSSTAMIRCFENNDFVSFCLKFPSRHQTRCSCSNNDDCLIQVSFFN
jgi:hypothetical protein